MTAAHVDPPRQDERESDGPIVSEHDGIEEQDNRLPRWWLYSLYATVVFGVGYWLHYQTFQSGTQPLAAYQAEQAAARAAEAEKVKAAGEVTPESLLALAKDDKTVAEGKQIFGETCAACHGPNAGGNIGPNLTDSNWLHGGAPDAIYRTVKDGFLPKGMPAWGTQLGETRVRAVTAFVVSIKGTHVAGGKAPQGEAE